MFSCNSFLKNINDTDSFIPLKRYGDSSAPALREQCYRALANSVEPLLVLGKNPEAARRIRQVLAQAKPADQASAIMPFLLWLADPQTPMQTVRKAIRALSPEVKLNWIFNSFRPVVAALPEPRKAQAQCFLAFFEKHHDREKLNAFLNEQVKKERLENQRKNKAK
jgi:hypothetical protein